jgi:ribonuclease-3
LIFNRLFQKNKHNKEELFLKGFILKKFGYNLKQIELFQEALTHRSVGHTVKDFSNERLEFLGDAILDAIIAEYLYQRFPTENEGYLTKVKSKIVSRKTLADIGENMGLRTVIQYNKGRSINVSTLEGNALEALLGAIYLDGGFESVRKAINHYILRNYIDLNRLLEEEIDFKSKLFIWAQKRRLKLEFEVVDEMNSGGSWSYTVITTINETRYGQGTGPSKKHAEQVASRETLELLGEL